MKQTMKLRFVEPVATVCYSSLHGISIENHAPDILEAGMKLYTHPQPIPDGCKNDAARWNFVMTTEPYALNLWNALPKNIYQQERHLNTAIDQAMLAAAPKEKS